MGGRRRVARQRERGHQTRLFAWAKMAEARWPELAWMFSTLNGVRLSVGAAVVAKRSGNKAGVPDVVFPVARGGFFGLWIELKDDERPAAVTAEQRAWHAALASEGHLVVVARGWQAAADAIEGYLARPATRVAP